jgi:hypothetical protein
LQNNARATHAFNQGESTTFHNEAVTRTEKNVTCAFGTGQPDCPGEALDQDSRSHGVYTQGAIVLQE